VLVLETNQTIGARSRWMRPIGPATTSARRSGKLSASVFGTSSPMMIDASAMTRVITTNAIESALSRIGPSQVGRRRIHWARPDEKATAPTAPDRKPRKVIAI
jgi:hypothetical protein